MDKELLEAFKAIIKAKDDLITQLQGEISRLRAHPPSPWSSITSPLNINTGHIDLTPITGIVSIDLPVANDLVQR